MPVVFFPDEFTPANYNNPELVDRFRVSAQKAIGEANVVASEPLMVGEDFSNFGQTEHKVPTVLYWLGTVTQEKIDRGNLPGLHSPFYYPEPETSIKTGVEVTTQALLDLFNSKN